MCGIIAVLGRPGTRPVPAPADVLEPLDAAARALHDGGPESDRLELAAEHVAATDRLLAGPPGVRALLAEPGLADEVERRVTDLEAAAAGVEAELDAGRLEAGDPATLERLNAALVRLRDVTWAVRSDRLPTARGVADLAGEAAPVAAEGYWAIQVALSALDRLEVRGRDSAGITVLVEGSGLDLTEPALAEELALRSGDLLFTSRAVRAQGGTLVFAYKAAAEIGELGDNSAALRAAVRDDALLQRALSAPGARTTLLGHTRWASVGTISEANAHPLDSVEADGGDRPYVLAALNGDVDNHVELRATHDLRVPPEVTTDAKVIPALVARHLADGAATTDAFRRTVAAFEGSVAIGSATADEPGRLLLALRGSGQALYVGMAEDAFVVASEPYGLVELTTRYLRMDGEAPGPGGEPGQVVVLDRDGAGSLEGIERLSYDGTPLPPAEGDVVGAEITTRDIDRGDFPHFFLKEVSEAPGSMRKTLRGRIVEGHDGTLRPILGEESLPGWLRERLEGRQIRSVVVVGQGTAAVAGQAVAAALADAVAGSGIVVTATPATELSGFGLRDEMDDTLVVAISQSGTTTDTNRTIDLVRARGAAVLAIVNRRNSDIVEKAAGVLYTSDGRDVEMSVASTKAFYAQIAAGVLLASAVGELLGTTAPATTSALLAGLRALPDAMQGVLDQREAVAEAAARLAPPRRHWAVVGNGYNRIAASETRIKLSELCYKAIACDATEDKKHVDLSSEPLILVCAAGLSGANADDVAKEVAIYRAHKAAPVVITTDGGGRFADALAIVRVPEAHPSLAFVLSAMAGHLFGYEAALSIDAGARPLREARAAVEGVLSGGIDAALLDRLAPALAGPVAAFAEGLRAGTYDGHLEASTAVQLTSLLRYATGLLPLDAYSLDHGKLGTPSVVVEDLTNALTRGIDELTRPVDAIKHQAKTVTVGISRSEDALLEAPLVQAVLAAGAPRDRLTYPALRTLAALDPAVAEVTGHTRYRVDGAVGDGTATVAVVDKGGVAAAIRSRTEVDPRLRGTKHRAASQRQVTVARGVRDGRMVLMVPEVKDSAVTGLTLLHLSFRPVLPAATARAVLEGYQGRYAALADAVTETEPVMADDVLGTVPIGDLLTVPVHVLAERWRGRGDAPPA
jgi:glucosamine--fructose-6-phosphate aminotransferase (isomerizing)